jgi:hypothetical protein
MRRTAVRCRKCDLQEDGLAWFGWQHDRRRWRTASSTERAAMLAAHYPINEWPTDIRLVREAGAWYVAEYLRARYEEDPGDVYFQSAAEWDAFDRVREGRR